MYIDITKTELEREVERLKHEFSTLKKYVRNLIKVAEERKIIKV